MTTTPSELERVLAALENRARRLTQANRDTFCDDAARLLREMARDFAWVCAQIGEDEVYYWNRDDTERLDAARARWRVPS